MLDIILHEMEGLSPEEKRGPIDAAKAAAARELAHAAGMAEPSMPGASPASRPASPAARTAPETGSDRGRPGDGALEEAARGLGPGTWAAAGARQGCRRALPASGIAEHAAARTDLQEDGGPGMANALHRRPSVLLAGFHVVSAKRLDRCLPWFMRPEQARRPDADRLLRACALQDDRSPPGPSGTIGRSRPPRQCWSSRGISKTERHPKCDTR